MINEIYHQIKAKESSFEELAARYGHGAERRKGGCIRKTRLNTPQPILVEKIRSSKKGDLIPPFKLNEWYIIMEILETNPAQLDNDIQEELINEAFSSYLTYSANQLMMHLSNQTN